MLGVIAGSKVFDGAKMNPTIFLLIGVAVLLLYLLWKNKLKIITAVVVFGLVFGGATFISPSMISTVGSFLSEKGINIPSLSSFDGVKEFITNQPAENQKVEIQGLEEKKSQDESKDTTEQAVAQEKDQQKSQEQNPQTKSEQQKPFQQQIVQEPSQKQDPAKKKKINNSLLDQLQRLLELYEKILKDKNGLEGQLDELRKQIDELRRLIEEQAQD